MTRRLLVGYLSITLFVLLVLEIPLGIGFANNERDELRTDVERDATVLATLVEDGLEHGAPTDYQAIADDYAVRTGGRVVIVDASGISLADTDAPVTDGASRDFSTRPEFEAALSGTRASGTRHSDTLDADFLYVAVPVASGGEALGAVRLTFPTAEVDARVRRTWLALGALALVVLATVTLVGFALARSVTRPLRDLETASDSMAGGDLSARASADEGPPEVRSVAATFNGMAARVERLVDSQRAFVADAAHQLRTPLTALRLRLENLAARSTPDAQADLSAAIEETTRLSRLVDQLLYLARVEEGEVPVEEVDVAAAIRERAEVWGPLAAEQDLSIRTDAPSRLSVRAAPGSVEQILDNLIENAVSVSPPGTEIEVRASVDEDEVEIHVADQGPGMSDEERTRAFDRFWRGAGSQATSQVGSQGAASAGLGLAIVRQLVEASGGRVELRQAASHGIDATVRLPHLPHPNHRSPRMLTSR